MTPPGYHGSLRTGVVHFGPGAFHRAHQADYLHRLAEAGDDRVGIAAVSLRSPGTVEALKAQSGVYTLAILDREPAYRRIAVHNRFYGPGAEAAVRRQLADPSVMIVSSTVTEKGYCLAADGTLDLGHPDIVHDLASPAAPRSLVGWLALGLADRRDSGLPAFTTLCCDNMTSNGAKLGAAVAAFASRLDPALGDWIAGEARIPDTMVDSITPATDDSLRQLVKAETGFDDDIPVRREAYCAWVIEDVLPGGLPDLRAAGAIITTDVRAWELAKLRLLNGAHSTLAYLGLLAGLETVADAMADPSLSAFAERLMRDDIAASLGSAPIDLGRYIDETLERFRNPAIGHRLSQIAWDGSQKLPYRLLDTAAEARQAGRRVDRLALPVAAWILFLRRKAASDSEIVDPLAAELASRAAAEDPVAALLSLRQIFPARLADDKAFAAAIRAGFTALSEDGPRRAAAALAGE